MIHTDGGRDAPPAGVDCDDGVVVRRAWDDLVAASVVVVEAVAAATGRKPMDLPVLQKSIDSESLDALFDAPTDGTGRPLRVSFTYAGTAVTVSDDGSVVVRPGTEDASESGRHGHS